LSRLRILQVILSRGFAGSERAVAETCNALSAEHDVAVVLRRDDRASGGASIRDHLDSAVEVIDVPPFWFTRTRLRGVLRQWRPDVVHTHLRRGTRYVAQVRPAAAHLCTVHISINGPHYLRADGIICMTEWQLATIPTHYQGRRFLIPNSLVPEPKLDPQRLGALRTELGVADGDYVIGGVGRVVPGKGFDVLIRAFEQARLPGSRLVVVGDGRELDRLKGLAGPAVHFTGYRPDAKRCFQVFDLFVSPSRREPFGRVIIEALDAGAPVVATDVAGPRDIARHYPVELVPPDDVDALAAALARARARPRARLALDLSQYHVDNVARRILDAYQETLNRASCPVAPVA
jgi:glycosyltransferase involved in cell wall biosynthesis